MPPLVCARPILTRLLVLYSLLPLQNFDLFALQGIAAKCAVQ
jgi:hypothetical protein